MRKISMGTFKCTEKDISYVLKALRENNLSAGPELNLFETLVSKLHNKKYGIAVNSGQSALETAIELAKHDLNKDVLNIAVPATTYAATLWAILNKVCNPIFVDVDSNYVIDWNAINTTKDIDVIMPVDLCGYSAAPPDSFIDKAYYIIQDACEAFGNKEACYGDIICHSFYVSHIITTGAGGMLSLNDGDLDNYARSYISHGRVFGGDFTKFADKWYDRFLFDKVGVSYRLSNIDAALGLSQLEKIEDIIEKRKEVATSYIDWYEQSDILKENFVFKGHEYAKKCIFQFFPIVIKNSKINREDLLNFLFKNGVDSRVLLSLTNQIAFKNIFGEIEHDYPNAQHYNNNGFIVGCHHNMDDEDAHYVCAILEDYCEKGI